MRMMRVFSIPALVCSVPGLKYENAQKFVRRLSEAGFIQKLGSFISGRVGVYKSYRLVKDVGPTMPVLSVGRFKKKETETEKEGEKETETETETETGKDLFEELEDDNC
jgi:hypothetical protein